MRKIILPAVIMVFYSCSIYSQTIYKIPFAAKDNRIELTVENSSAVSAKFVNVKVDSCPSWVKMKTVETAVGEIPAGEDKEFIFNFDIDMTAPVGMEESIKFLITCGEAKKGTEETWSKEIKIKASAPDKYELFQNYPNPFNPATTISFQLPYDSRVTIKIYDILGREVETLISENRKSGYYREKFNAGMLSSGVYIYRITAKSTSGIPYDFASVKKMMVIK